MIKVFFLVLLFCGICFANEPINWSDSAGFYESNYITCTKNEKAKMLYDSMIRNGEKASLVEKVYKVRVYEVYNNGVKYWPIKRENNNNNKTPDRYKNLNDRIQELEATL